MSCGSSRPTPVRAVSTSVVVWSRWSAPTGRATRRRHPTSGWPGAPDGLAACGTLAGMPWLPEAFTAPVMQQILDERRRAALAAVPYYDGLLAGDPDPLVESFAGEPEVHDPVRGRVKGAAAFRAFVIETHAWLEEHRATVEDVEHVVLERHGFEEVVLHLATDRDTVDLPVAVVADRLADGRIEEVRVYFSTRSLVGRPRVRQPLLQPGAGLLVPDEVTAQLRTYYEQRYPDRDGLTLESCALVDDGRACALEHNVVWSQATGALPEAGLAVVVRGGTPAIRVYGDLEPPE